MSFQLNGVKTNFLNTVKIAAIAVPLTLGTAFQAQAERPLTDEEKVHAMCTMPYKGYECATGGWQEPMTRQDIEDSEFAKNRIVYHFGKGIIRAGLGADILTEYGAPTIAIPGGTDGMVDVYIDGQFKKSFTQSQLDTGVIAVGASKIYARMMQRKGLSPQEISNIQIPSSPEVSQ